jgi:hypothetical protein
MGADKPFYNGGESGLLMCICTSTLPKRCEPLSLTVKHCSQLIKTILNTLQNKFNTRDSNLKNDVVKRCKKQAPDKNIVPSVMGLLVVNDSTPP